MLGHRKMLQQPKENTRLGSLGPCSAIRIHIKAVSLNGLGIVDRNGSTVPYSTLQVIHQGAKEDLWQNEHLVLLFDVQFQRRLVE